MTALIVGWCAASAISAPAVVPGWPVAAPSGSVHDRPGGGATVIVDTVTRIEDPLAGIFAFDRHGRQLWRRYVDCTLGIDCALTEQPASLLPDGTYGPFSGRGALLNVGRRGRTVRPACGGALLADGTCVTAVVSGTEPPTIRATRAGTELWRHVEQDTPPANPSEEPRTVDVLVDDAGVLYVTLNDERPVQSNYVLAIDSVSGAVRWRLPGAFAADVLQRGVMVVAGTTLSAMNGDGTTRWTRSTRDVGSGAVTDPTRGIVYVQQGGKSDRITALDAATGIERWRIAGPPSRSISEFGPSIVSLGRTGTVYMSTVRRGRYGLDAVAPDGRRVWRYETATELVDAVELADGTIAISTKGPTDGSIQSLLTRIDPRRAAPAVTAARVALRSRVVRMNCADLDRCIDEIRDGTILRMDLPRPARVSLRLLNERGGRPDRRNPPGFQESIAVSAPRGTSFLRVLDLGNSGGETIDPLGNDDGIVRPGRYVFEVSWRDRGHRFTRRIPIVIRVTARGPALPGLP